MNIKKLITLLCDTTEQKEDYKLHRGTILNINLYGNMQDLENLLSKVGGFKELAGENSINYCFKNDIEMITVCYCEGDITISQHDNKNSYDKRVKETIEFYNNL